MFNLGLVIFSTVYAPRVRAFRMGWDKGVRTTPLLSTYVINKGGRVVFSMPKHRSGLPTALLPHFLLIPKRSREILCSGYFGTNLYKPFAVLYHHQGGGGGLSVTSSQCQSGILTDHKKVVIQKINEIDVLQTYNRS